MSSIRNPDLGMGIRFMGYPHEPANARLDIHASHGGMYEFSEGVPLGDVPRELLAADLGTLLAHPWTLPLIEEAKAKLVERFKQLSKEI